MIEALRRRYWLKANIISGADLRNKYPVSVNYGSGLYLIIFVHSEKKYVVRKVPVENP